MTMAKRTFGADPSATDRLYWTTNLFYDLERINQEVIGGKVLAPDWEYQVALAVAAQQRAGWLPSDKED